MLLFDLSDEQKQNGEGIIRKSRIDLFNLYQTYQPLIPRCSSSNLNSWSAIQMTRSAS